MKTKWEIWKEKNNKDSIVLWDMVNPKINKMSKVEAQERLDICLNCDKLIKATKQCKKCGCFMEMKTRLPHAYCPIGKWGAIDANN